ncbi:MAG: DUF3408 domain-containing protein [Paraprevotella sp.]|nr:DUF3408 domain-containing protein [Paraprevotella sp.]
MKRRKGDGAEKTGASQARTPEKADIVIRIVDESLTERSADFLRYLAPRNGAHRQCVYLSRETHGRLSRIVRTLGGNGSTIGGYIENVLEEHLRTYGDDIAALMRRETSQPF